MTHGRADCLHQDLIWSRFWHRDLVEMNLPIFGVPSTDGISSINLREYWGWLTVGLSSWPALASVTVPGETPSFRYGLSD